MKRKGFIERHGVVWEYTYEAGLTGQNGPDFWSPDDEPEVDIRSGEVVDDREWESHTEGRNFTPIEWVECGPGRDDIVAEIIDKEEHQYHD